MLNVCFVHYGICLLRGSWFLATYLSLTELEYVQRFQKSLVARRVRNFRHIGELN